MHKIMFSDKDYRSGFKKVLIEVAKLGWKNVSNFEAIEDGVKLTLTSDRGRNLKLVIPLPLKDQKIICDDELIKLTSKGCLNLKAIYENFIEEVDRLEPATDLLGDLDRTCKVLDPDPPKPGDLHRQIVLKPGVFLRIQINPDQSDALPQLTFLGPDSEVQKLRMNVNENVEDYDPEVNLVENLEKILCVEIPSADRVDENRDEFNVDCGICYSHNLNGNLPDFPCESDLCGKRFHSECLYTWLQQERSRNNHQDNDKWRIRGKCLYCGSQITCERPH